jgi:hypothetical protein
MSVRGFVPGVGMIMPEPNEGYFAGLSTFYAEMEGFQRQGKDPVLMEWSRFKTTEDEDGTDIYDGDIVEIIYTEGVRHRTAIYRVTFSFEYQTYMLSDIRSNEKILMYNLHNMPDDVSILEVNVVGNQYENRELLVVES